MRFYFFSSRRIILKNILLSIKINPKFYKKSENSVSFKIMFLNKANSSCNKFEIEATFRNINGHQDN